MWRIQSSRVSKEVIMSLMVEGGYQGVDRLGYNELTFRLGDPINVIGAPKDLAKVVWGSGRSLAR